MLPGSSSRPFGPPLPSCRLLFFPASIKLFPQFRAIAAVADNEIVPPVDTVLDTAQLRDITLNDEHLMRQVLAAVLDDTSRQIELLENAVREGNSQVCARLAHYCKGACANIGAGRAAAVFREIEANAASGQIGDCTASLDLLGRELELLRSASLPFQ